MFNNTKYTKWYFSIVDTARTKSTSGYTEQHHIIPKCLGGTDDVNNLVNLSAREHFVCHWLLTKMVSNKKEQYQLWNAFSCMLYRENANQQRYKVSSKVFENIKIAGARIKSVRFSGTGNPMYGKKGKLSPLYGIKKSHSHIEKIRQGNFSKLRSAESREKQSITTSGRTQSAEWVEKRKQFGEANGMYGKKLSQETIARRTATRKANLLAKKLAQGM